LVEQTGGTRPASDAGKGYRINASGEGIKSSDGERSTTEKKALIVKPLRQRQMFEVLRQDAADSTDFHAPPTIRYKLKTILSLKSLPQQ
jgi:hypothetical protein